ncbi:hypothetical protein MPLSOD_10057 [Mesorhizobium sp. SOD10]|nr:hypothetical protein MPLSOD_10057 [Mesorhizobium sp. SOD10]
MPTRAAMASIDSAAMMVWLRPSMTTGKASGSLACSKVCIGAAGTERHVDCLIDLIGADIAHDLVTVTRYSATRTPEFVKHRRLSDEMVRRYLDNYYVFDPFYASWRSQRRLGVMPLKGLADEEAKRGQYIAGFLAQSESATRSASCWRMAATGASASSSTARPCRSRTARSRC